MENPFTKGYCDVTFVDSLIMTLTALAVLFLAGFAHYYFVERKKSN